MPYTLHTHTHTHTHVHTHTHTRTFTAQVQSCSSSFHYGMQLAPELVFNAGRSEAGLSHEGVCALGRQFQHWRRESAMLTHSEMHTHTHTHTSSHIPSGKDTHT